jgi:glutaredoxin 3
MLDDIKGRLFGDRDLPIPDSTLVHKPNSAEVVMYATRFCPYCMRARALLSQKGVAFSEVAVDGKPELRTEMVEKSGRYTVPQIWIDDEHIGGCDELMALDRAGQLDPILTRQAKDQG